MKEKGQKSFVVFHDWYETIKDFSDEDLGKLLRAMFEYETERNVVTNLEPMCSMAFRFIKQAFDRNREAYEETCRKNKENADKRWGEGKKKQGKS